MTDHILLKFSKCESYVSLIIIRFVIFARYTCNESTNAKQGMKFTEKESAYVHVYKCFNNN